jgi:hypothetical protein
LYLKQAEVTKKLIAAKFFVKFEARVYKIYFYYRDDHCETYRGADKSLARPTSRRILFDGENISFDASLVIYTNSTNIPPITIINRIYETEIILWL